MKKILIISYYWPPKGGVGVQRWLKLSKYLAKENTEITVYTPEGVGSNLKDNQLSVPNEKNFNVIKTSIFEPQKLLKSIFNFQYSSDFLVRPKNRFMDEILIFLRSNFFIPDTRCCWIRKSIKYLDNYLQSNQIDVIISTGPPHSMHLIAERIKHLHNVKWIADFRDPWTDIEYFDKIKLISFVRKKHFQLEKKVLSRADLVISVSPSWTKKFHDLGAKKTFCLPNGFDSEDYKIFTKNNNRGFKIGHFGIYNELRDYNVLWKALSELINSNNKFKSDLKLFFAGEVHNLFFQNIDSYNLSSHLQYHSYINHVQSISNMLQCDLLLVTQGETKSVSGRIPAKVFEYLKARRPILAIGKKNSDLYNLLKNISYSYFVDYNNINTNKLKDVILQIYHDNQLDYNFSDDISQFCRQYQAKQLLKEIHNL
tara:strand:- start:5514 stop:6791 length:1278 start_codon:yes stop_codon:yes gene_type:complete